MSGLPFKRCDGADVPNQRMGDPRGLSAMVTAAPFRSAALPPPLRRQAILLPTPCDQAAGFSQFANLGDDLINSLLV